MTTLSPTEARLVEAIDPAPILARTLEWAAVNSGTGNLAGLAAMAGLLADACAGLPGEVAFAQPAPVGKIDAAGRPLAIEHGQHLVLRVRPQASRRVLLTGHMDTVFGADHPFQACRWLDAETVNGPGTADMKGGLALLIAALHAFEATAPALGYDLMINSDEETGSLSSAPLIRELAAGKLAALTYEPALPDGAMARARPGSGNFAAHVAGRSAHAGRNPEDGRNAIVAAADLALRLAAAARPGLGLNPARIDGGGPDNMVPDTAVLRFNVRPADPEALAEARALIDGAVAQVSAAHDVSIHLHGGFGRPPKAISSATEALFGGVRQAARDLGGDLAWADTGGVCDGNNIAACGVPVIDTMGALGGAIHSSDEFLHVSSLRGRAQLSALVLHRIETGVIGS
jgi:glutamate carboxypeptidase